MRRREVAAVQLASFADSAAAVRMRDSLAGAGWTASLAEGEVDGGRVYRVRIALSETPELPEMVAAVLQREGRAALAVRDSSSVAETVDLIRVNRGTRGMAAQLRWALAPDRHALLAVEDPAAVEAEPVPNGFVLASERGPLVLRRDSVWDVAPSPDWRWLAWGRAAGRFAREQQGLTRDQWRDMAREIGLPEPVVREAAFPISGMAIAFGIARPAIAHLGAAGMRRAEDVPVLTPDMAGGWRVRWSRSGQLLGVGAAPEMVQDFSPSPRYEVVDTQGRPVTDARARAAEWHEVPWVEGPVLDVSIELDLAARAGIPVEGGTVESRGGWIALVDAGGSRRLVGPGVALAATRSGTFVVALAPDPSAGEYEPKARFVVYHVRH